MTNDRFGSACPDPEMLSAYLDGKLDATQRGPIEDHISRCEDCYFVVRETALSVAETGAPPANLEPSTPPALTGTLGLVEAPRQSGVVQVRPRGSLIGRYILPMAATLIVGAGSIFLWRQAQPADPYSDAVSPLVEAVGARRFFEPRLTGGFAFGPLITPHRGAEQGPDNWAVLGEAAKLESSARADRSVPMRRALAAALVLAGQPERAIGELESLSKESPAAEVWSDLSAALLVRAKDGHPGDAPRALDAAVRSLRLRGDLPEALHNKALALETLGLIDDARATWLLLADQLKSDPWADEARRRAEELAEKISDHGGDPLVEAPEPEDPAWSAWASKVLTQQPADEALVLASSRADESYLEAARNLAALKGAERRIAALAIADLFAAVTSSKSDRWQESKTLSFAAAARLRSISDPIYRLALIRAGAAEYYLTENRSALNTLQKAYEGVPSAHRLVRARAGWMVGTLLTVREEFFEAAHVHRESASLYLELGQGAHAAFVSGLYAQDLFAQGLEDEAWAIWATLTADPKMRAQPPRRQFTVLWEAARRLLDESPCASLQFLDRAVTLSESAGESGIEFAAKVRRGRAALRCGEHALAASDESRARSLIAGIPADLRARWTRDADLLAAEIRLAAGDTTASLAETEEFFRASGNNFQAIEVGRMEAVAASSRGDLDGAIAALARERQHYLQVSSRLNPVEVRILAARQAAVRSRLIDLLVEAGRGEEALAAAVEAQGPWRGEVAISAMERMAMAEGRAIAVLASCGARVCGWSLTAAGTGRAGRIVGDARPGVVSKALQLLFVESPREVTVVSDLNLSWGREFALAERGGNLTLTLGMLAPESRLPVSAADGVAVLSSSEATEVGTRSLPGLPNVRREVDTLVARYGRQVTMVRPSHLAADASARRILHIAGHQIAGGRGIGGLFVLGRDSVLGAASVTRLRWKALPQVAIVNVCAADVGESETSLSLAQAFSLIGIPRVVFSTEAVRDARALGAATAMHESGMLNRLGASLKAIRSGCTHSTQECSPYVEMTRLPVSGGNV